MSAWGDMMRRSSGQLKRKEDEYILDVEGALDQNITYNGIINQSTIPSNPHTGQYYITMGDTIIEGVQYPSGIALMYDGNRWVNIGLEMPLRVDTDANTFYYQSEDLI